MVKNLPAMQETQVCSLGLEDPLEKRMATHSSILPGESMDRGAWLIIVFGITVRHDRKTFTDGILIYLNKTVVLLFFKK